MDRSHDEGQVWKMEQVNYGLVAKRWKKESWKTMHEMGRRPEKDRWPTMETGDSGQAAVEDVGGGLYQ